MNSTLQWLYCAELPDGGISAWQNPSGSFHIFYPEITGYVLPTLFKWSGDDLAVRCADKLLQVQNGDGSFNGIDGVPRPFDTSAVVEGLMAAYRHTRNDRYFYAAYNAQEWMMTHITSDGYLKNSPTNPEPCVYNLRASAIIQNRRELEYWQKRGLISRQQERSHYLAYALEGALNFGAEGFAMPYIELAYNSGNLLQPFYVSHDWRPIYADFDICASAQMAILFHRVGLNASKHYEAVKKCVTESGGLPQSTADNRRISWAAKFYLDLAYLMGDK